MRSRQERVKGGDRSPGDKPASSYWAGRAPVIVVPLDGSLESKLALPVARLISKIGGATIHVVHASDESLTPRDLVDRLKLSPAEAAGLIVERLSGAPSVAVVRAAAEMDARLIVLTTRGRTAYLGRTLRPVAEAVLRSASCPVVMVRPEIGDKIARTARLRRLLLPIDGAPSTMSVVGPALELAEQSGADIDVVYVAEAHAVQPREAGTITAPHYIDQPQHELPAWAREFLSRVCCVHGRTPIVKIRVFLRGGEPGAEILRLALEREIDLIVLEWRGRLDPNHARVVRRVLEGAPCPVLLLRT